FRYEGGKKAIEAMTLQGAANKLQQVTVVARRSLVEVRAEKTILNVEGTINSTGLNALELLRKSPGVTVDNNENLNVKGKNSVRIQVDGRDVPMDGRDLAAFLKGMQASDIASIEIISNPSAKYDAAGNAGIINIRMKKNKAFGTNGNVGAEGTYGVDFKYGANLSLNHRTKKFNVFGSGNIHRGNWHNWQNFYRQQLQSTDSLTGVEDWRLFEQKGTNENKNRYSGFRIGTDYFANDKHTFGVLVNGSYNPEDWSAQTTSRISTRGSENRIDSVLFASNYVDGSRRDLNVNLNYRFADTSGHTFNVDLDRGAYRLRGQSYQPNYYRSPSGAEEFSTRIYRNNTPTDINIWTARADYEQRLWGGAFGAGVKISSVQTFNTFDFFNVIGNESVKDELRSNSVDYKEETQAGYLNYNRKLGKNLNLQAGLRLENTRYKGIGEDSIFTNNYLELFPSAALTYSFNEKLGLNATYSRRIDRPSYQDLNPFQNKLDELTYEQGNPMLVPQFTHSFELSPTFKGYPVLTLGYSHTNDVFTQILRRDALEPRATFITRENLAEQTNYTLSLNAPTPFAKWWEGMVSITALRSRFEADFSTPDDPNFKFDRAFNTLSLYAEQTLRLPKGFSLQLSGWYSAPAFWGTLRTNAQGAVDFGIQKKILHDKGELRLRLGDFLHTANWSGINFFTPGLLMDANGRWESRIVTLNFSYRFGSSEVKGARQRKTGLEDEKSRVKSRG
ncbi:MAG TPA: TonB-dependent receptor, partial [Saprospiraceae bacterium]|nr:TonB-dependent receptor [Saprospiraceae bacterium]